MKNRVLSLLLVFLSMCMSVNLCAQEKIKMYTFFTPSHTVFKDKWFLPTLKDDGIELVMREYPQECESGKVFTAGWQSAMLRKVDMIIEAIKDNWGMPIIYSDIDVQFLAENPSKHIIKILGDKDLVIQRDTPSGTVCAGFFACRANHKTLALFEGVRGSMIARNECSDQKTLNKLLRKGKDKERNPYKIVWDYLPVEFLGGGTLTGCGWSPKRHMFIPDNIVLHHANWVIGTPGKIEQLEYVRRRVEQKRAIARKAATGKRS
jgi:hypothetical protein